MLKTETRTIDGFNYEITMYPASMGLDILADVTSLVAEPLGRTEDGMGEAAKALVSQLSGSKLSTLAQKIIGQNVKIDGKPMAGENVFDLHFAGRYKAMAEVMGFVLEVNYSDFWNDLKQMISSLMADLKVVPIGEQPSEDSDQPKETNQD